MTARLSRINPWALAGALAVVAVALPVSALLAAHALDVPWADDWGFERVAATLERTGRVDLIGWGDGTLVGHALLGVPWIAAFGAGMESVHWAGVTAAVIGLLGTFALFRQFLAPATALVGTAAVGLSPLYALLAGTYMSDIPAFATEMWCMALGVTALGSPSRRWVAIVASLAIGLFGFTMRESAICAPIAVLVALFVAADSKRERVRVVVAAGVFALAAVAFYSWRQGLETPLFARTPQLDLHNDVVSFCKGLMLIALIAFPASVAVAAGARKGFLRDRSALLGAALAVTAALVPLSQARYYDTQMTIFPGNLITREGALGDRVLAGTRPDLFPPVAWGGIELMAVLSGCVVLGVLVRTALARPRVVNPRAWVIAVHLIASLAAFAARIDTGAAVFDRYILTTTAVATLAVLAAGTPEATRAGRSVAAGATALLLPAVVGIVLVHDSAAYTAARWTEGERAVAGGLAPDSVDAGFEWAGYHTRGDINHTPRAAGAAGPAMRGVAGQYTMSLGDRPCVVVADSPQTEGRLLRTTRYDSLGGLVKRSLYVYRLRGPCLHAPVG